MNIDQQKALARICEVSAFGQFASVGYKAFESGNWYMFLASFILFIIILLIEYAILSLNADKENED